MKVITYWYPDIGWLNNPYLVLQTLANPSPQLHASKPSSKGPLHGLSHLSPHERVSWLLPPPSKTTISNPLPLRAIFSLTTRSTVHLPPLLSTLPPALPLFTLPDPQYPPRLSPPLYSLRCFYSFIFFLWFTLLFF